MRAEEVKKRNSMRSVVERYGFHVNRSGFISCPFHKEKTASMKIYNDSFYCFGCGASGDIFEFVQRIDHCDFKTAFFSLGGSYEKTTFESKLAVYRQKKREEERKREADRLRKKRELNNMLIDIYRYHMNRSEPLSDTWCDCYNALQYQLYLHEILNGEEVIQCSH